MNSPFALRFGAMLLASAVSLGASAQALKAADIQKALDEAYTKYQNLEEGKNADYIPALAKVDSKIYGIALVTTDGKVYTKGDIASEVSIQSISKVFTMAKVIEEQNPKAIEDNMSRCTASLRSSTAVCATPTSVCSTTAAGRARRRCAGAGARYSHAWRRTCACATTTRTAATPTG